MSTRGAQQIQTGRERVERLDALLLRNQNAYQDAMTARLQKEGYDGIVLKGLDEGDSLVAFTPGSVRVTKG